MNKIKSKYYSNTYESLLEAQESCINYMDRFIQLHKDKLFENGNTTKMHSAKAVSKRAKEN